MSIIHLVCLRPNHTIYYSVPRDLLGLDCLLKSVAILIDQLLVFQNIID